MRKKSVRHPTSPAYANSRVLTYTDLRRVADRMAGLLGIGSPPSEASTETLSTWIVVHQSRIQACQRPWYRMSTVQMSSLLRDGHFHLLGQRFGSPEHNVMPSSSPGKVGFR
jgi:hypothetical protein